MPESHRPECFFLLSLIIPVMTDIQVIAARCQLGWSILRVSPRFSVVTVLDYTVWSKSRWSGDFFRAVSTLGLTPFSIVIKARLAPYFCRQQHYYPPFANSVGKIFFSLTCVGFWLILPGDARPWLSTRWLLWLFTVSYSDSPTCIILWVTKSLKDSFTWLRSLFCCFLWRVGTVIVLTTEVALNVAGRKFCKQDKMIEKNIFGKFGFGKLAHIIKRVGCVLLGYLLFENVSFDINL